MIEHGKFHKSNALAIAVTAAGCLSAIPALAEKSYQLEEVLVTAQKRAESLQDVPISVSALDGGKLSDAGINKIDDLTVYVPNLQMTESGISTQMRIRGIGSGNNQGFEQSVGQYIDGIYYGRAQLIRAPFLDLERVEVLRGPQSILFGKNSIAGALNLTSAKPTDDFEAEVSALYEPDLNQREVTVVLSGPLMEGLRGRLSYRSYREDGYIQNTFNGDDEPARDEEALRATFVWDASDDLTLTLKAERDTFDVDGRQIEIVQDTPNPISGATYSQVLQSFGEPGFDSELDGRRQADGGDTSNNELSNVTLTADYALAENTLTLVSGWVEYDYEEVCDCDFVAADVFTLPMAEDYHQFSQEIRLTSPGGETVDWIAGAFYQRSAQNFSDLARFSSNSVLVADLGLPIGGTGVRRDFEQDSDLWALFGQATWSLRPDLRLALGARYTREEKEGGRRIDAVDLASGEPLSSGALPALVYLGAFAIETEQTTGHDLAGQRTESAFTPLVNLQYDFSEQVMLYASATTGFKAGGFDARANNVNSFEFEEERARSYEMGAKSTLADGAAELNLAFYYTEYEDLQISQFDGTLGFNVGNAKKSVVQGMELDGRWRLSENFTLSYALAYLDFEYKDFTNGNCYNGQIPDGDMAPWGVQLCDYTGKAAQYTPKKTANLGLEHRLPLSGYLELRSNLDLQYLDNQNVHPNLDPQYDLDPRTVVNLRVSIGSDHWSLALLGENLTDEDLMTYAGNAPLSASTFGTNTFYAFTQRPRTVAVEGRYRF